MILLARPDYPVPVRKYSVFEYTVFVYSVS